MVLTYKLFNKTGRDFLNNYKSILPLIIDMILSKIYYALNLIVTI